MERSTPPPASPGPAADPAAQLAGLLASAGWRESVEGIEVVYGAGSIGHLGELAAELDAGRVLLVTDPGISASGHTERAAASLTAAEIECRVFDAVEENPGGPTVERGVAAAREVDAELIVGLGGGSAMDAAKAIDLLLTNGGRIEDYEGFGHARRALLPAIGVPTTAGTGSEAQSYALLTAAESHRKMACGDPGMRFRAVILDPELPATAPRGTRAASGLDAVSHAIESFVTERRNPESIGLAKISWELLDRHLEGVLGSTPRRDDHETWGALQIAAFLAGAAIERSMLGAAHACANPLTARYGTVHGVAVALMLPAVIRYNGAIVEGLYGELAGDRAAAGEAAEHLANRVEALRRAGGLPTGLAELGIEAADLEALAEDAASQWTLQFNPRPADHDDLVSLYERSL